MSVGFAMLILNKATEGNYCGTKQTKLSKHADNKWVILALLALAQFMVILDVAIVNVALPTISKKLNFAPNDLQWVVTAYTLTFGGFLLLGGRASDLLVDVRYLWLPSVSSLLCPYFVDWLSQRPCLYLLVLFRV